MTWLAFAMLTVCSWGLYGVFLHQGQHYMQDPVNGRYKAYLFVGVAYFLTAVLAPFLLLLARGAAFDGYTGLGIKWSLIAGTAGAVGAFGVLLAFGAGGRPAVVMSIVFAGAPIINAVHALILHPPAGGWSSIKWPFYFGILLAAMGGCLVTLFKPNPAPARPQAAAVQSGPTGTSAPSPQP